jgi:internalin A
MAQNAAYRKAVKKIKAARRSGATELDLSNMELTELPESLGQLTQLQKLSLWGNQLTALPESLGQLTQLQKLNIHSNELTALPESLGGLTQLQMLLLAVNQLTALPESLGQLTQLQILDLEGNQLTALPESLRRLTTLKQLFLHGNEQLGLPPEVLGPTFVDTLLETKEQPAPPADILDYYFRTRRGRRPLNEAKLILVGRGGVGKTCLIKRLIHGTFDEHEPETPGIEIQPWQVTLADGDEVRLHVWDFGGQEILHATHQFFLTERTVYLLVLSGREGAATQDAEYWLQLIRSFGGDSPVIVALNKSQQHPFDVNRGLLLEKYPQIAGFVPTDCERAADSTIAADGAEAMGIEDLRQLMLGETGGLEHRKADFPADWFAIKERLAGMQENFVTWDQYQEICRELGEQDAKAQRDLAGFLHILGIALNYRDDPRLSDTHVLNPRWVTEGIYSILRAGQQDKPKRQGVLETGDLAKFLEVRDYPPSCHDFLLTLMEKFHLCFPLQGEHKRYLVPELLGENQPEEIRSLLAEPGLGFRYQYQVVPEGLLPRFIVQTNAHSESHPELRWRTGVVLERDECRAVVRADARERRVDIHVTGPERQRRDLLAIIRDKFDEQHRDLKGLNVEQRVPVPGFPEVTISYRKLLSLEERGKADYEPENMDEPVSVQDLLNGLESIASRDKRRQRAAQSARQGPMSTIELFYSYSHKDEELRDELENHLALLKRRDVIRGWHDRRITAGKEWADQIDGRLKSADVILLLVSADFLASDYCYDVEMQRAMERHAAGEAVVIPVILREVDWHSALFGKLQALPKDGKPVTSWSNRDEAFTDIARGIRRAVEQLTNS